MLLVSPTRALFDLSGRRIRTEIPLFDDNWNSRMILGIRYLWRRCFALPCRFHTEARHVQFDDHAVMHKAIDCSASALSKLEIGVHRHFRAGGNPDRDTGFPPARE